MVKVVIHNSNVERDLISIEYILYTYSVLAQLFFLLLTHFFANILQANFSLLLSSFYTKVTKVGNDTFCNPFILEILQKNGL